MDTSFLSHTQRKLLGIALGLVSFAVIVFFIFSLFYLLQSFVSRFSSVIWPLAIAAMLAMLLKPAVLIFEHRLHLSRIKSIILLYAFAALAGLLVISLLLPIIFSQVLNLIDFLPIFIQELKTTLSERYPEAATRLKDWFQGNPLEEIGTLIAQNFRTVIESSLPALAKLNALLKSSFALTAGIAIIPVYLFFLLQSKRDFSKDLDQQLSWVRENWRNDAIFLLHQFSESMVSFFRGQILIASIMGVLLAIGFSIAGIQFGIVLGMLIGFLNIIPYLGSIIGLALVLPIAWFQPEGGIYPLTGAIAVFAIVQIIEGYLLTPKIMGDRTGLHPMVIIIAIFFWGTALNGLLGMILAIPLTAFLVVAWRLLRQKYLLAEQPM